jgi:hypothetical protein
MPYQKQKIGELHWGSQTLKLSWVFVEMAIVSPGKLDYI